MDWSKLYTVGKRRYICQDALKVATGLVNNIQTKFYYFTEAKLNLKNLLLFSFPFDFSLGFG